MLRKVYVAWNSKGKHGLLFSFRGESLTIAAYNLTITLNSRGVDVVASIKDTKVYEIGKRKYVYIIFKEKIQPLPTGKSDIIDKAFTSGFEIIVTHINDNNYITVVTPGSWLYNYIILTNDTLMLELSKKRDVYFERLEDEVVVHIV